MSSESTPSIDGEWHRISPIAVVFFLAKTLKQLGGQFIYLIPAFLILGKSIKENPGVTIPSIIGILLLLICFAVASFLVYRYRLTNDTIEIRSGIFNKTQTHLPFTRIQNIRFEQPIYYRISDYCCMQLDTAGSAKNEAKLIAIKMDHAIALKETILGARAAADVPTTADGTEANPAETQTQELILNRRSVGDLVIHGLTNNRIWIFLGAAAPLFDEFADSIGSAFSYIGIDLQQLFDVDAQGYAVVALAALSFTMIAMMILALFSVAGSILTYYGYTLSRAGQRYIRRSGLLTKHEVALPLRRLQSIEFKQDWLDLLLKRVNLTFKQNQTGNPGQPGVETNSKLIVPSVFPEEAFDLANDAMPGTQLNRAAFKPIHRRFIISKMLFMWIPISLLASAIVWLNSDWLKAIEVFGAIVFIGALVSYLRWRRWGFGGDEQFVYIRKGFIGVSYKCFERHKLQQISQSQSWFMRRRNLCKIQFVLASGSISVPYLPVADAVDLVDGSLYITESSGKSWM
ncbi:PH domain-containing protein [Umboniibacter marinipuniceus]|uniref:Putative membrane protein n=1 Tax=Umboniibacter marinipuniceus TaxID=569599 RepID=A0A3M0AIA4_9GAMM|nr:PH domain-containing protein [Umboniibacter marinipuniceus]RMA82448.1 putative membrane protein [Umboniibacter marinipuniceus]